MNQPLPLVEQLRNLEQLQELDLKIDSIKKNQNSLPANLKSVDDALKKVRASFEVKKNQILEFEKTARQTQAALELNQERLARSSAKLEGVQNSQEFQAASKEIEQLKKLTANLEEQKKKSSAELESHQKEFTILQEQLEKLESERAAQSLTLSGQDEVLKTDLGQIVLERSKYLVNIEKRILSLYDRIRAGRGGIGIVPALGGRCKACNMIVPPQLYNEIQRGKVLHTCPSCSRILFAPVATKDSLEDQLQVANG